MPYPQHDSLLERFDLTVQQLDYAFVRECNDPVVLEQILEVLRSGEQGHYPHLIQFTEEHLAQVKPDSRHLLTPQPPTRPHDLPSSELAALEEELSSWAADLRMEEEKLTGRRRGERRNNELKEDDDDDDDDDDGPYTDPLPPDLPPLDLIDGSETNQHKVKNSKSSRDYLTKITRGQHRSLGSLITDVSQEGQGTHDHQGRVINRSSRSNGSLIEVIDGSDCDEVKDKYLTVTHTSGDSVIKVTSGQGGQRACSRQVEGLMREAERQESEGDVLSASLTYNKVLSLSPHNTKARHALYMLLKGQSESPSVLPSATSLVQEVE